MPALLSPTACGSAYGHHMNLVGARGDDILLIKVGWRATDRAGVLFAVRRRQPMMAHDFRRLSDIVGADGDSLCVSETPCVVE